MMITLRYCTRISCTASFIALICTSSGLFSLVMALICALICRNPFMAIRNTSSMKKITAPKPSPRRMATDICFVLISTLPRSLLAAVLG